MNFMQEPLLIFTAPLEIRVFIGVMFSLSAAILFSLALEEGAYPSVRKCIRAVTSGEFWIRRQRRRWLYRTSFQAVASRAGEMMRPRYIAGTT